MLKELIKLRKELHKQPEISGDEEGTAKRIVEELTKCNPDEILENVGGTGVVAKFSSGKESVDETLLFRAELDAIAVNEETELPYQSGKKGLMHGCGHDGHMTILIGLAHYLKQNRPEDKDIILLFQPSEETGEGAEKVLADVRFQNLNIDHGFALHNLPGENENSVIIKSGVFAAASTGVEVIFKGKSSHAAFPEKGINPSLQIAGLLQDVETLLAEFKKKDPSNKAVNTFIRLGEPAYGINPGTGKLGFTLRSPSDESLSDAVNRLSGLAKRYGENFKGSVEVKNVQPFSATINSTEGAQAVQIASEAIGLKVIEIDKPFPWSEDFGEFRKHFPITLFGLGAGEDSYPLHSEKYDFNDNLISGGIEVFKSIIKVF